MSGGVAGAGSGATNAAGPDRRGWPWWRRERLFDGLHPNDAGYATMAETWYETISVFLR